MHLMVLHFYKLQHVKGTATQRLMIFYKYTSIVMFSFIPKSNNTTTVLQQHPIGDYYVAGLKNK
jgi:hypothetical protein